MTKYYRYLITLILLIVTVSLYQNCGDVRIKKSGEKSALTNSPPQANYPDDEFKSGSPTLGCNNGTGWKWFADGAFTIPGIVGVDFYPATLWADDTHGLFLVGRSSTASSYYQVIVRSQDQGLSWQVLDGPPTTGPATYWPQLAAAQDGSLYLAYNIDNSTLQMKKSTNGGTNWTTVNVSSLATKAFIESLPNSELLWVRDTRPIVYVDLSNDGAATWQNNIITFNSANLETLEAPKLILDGSRAALSFARPAAGAAISNYKVRSVYGTSPGTVLVDAQITDNKVYLDFAQDTDSSFYLVGHNTTTGIIERWHNGQSEVVYSVGYGYVQSIVLDKDGHLWASRYNALNGKIEVLKSDDGSTWSVFASTSTTYRYNISKLRLDEYGYPILMTSNDTMSAHLTEFGFGRYCP